MPAISPTELRCILDKLDLTLAELAQLCRFTPSLPAAGAAQECRTDRRAS